jgi:hypothetical protein
VRCVNTNAYTDLTDTHDTDNLLSQHLCFAYMRNCINLLYTDLTDAENAALMKITASDMLHYWEQTRQQLYGGGSSLTVTGMTI